MVKGITKKYLVYQERNKLKLDTDPIKFFKKIDISDEYYFKYEKKEYQAILQHGIKGNGKSFAMQWFLEQYSEKKKCRCIYITMSDLIEQLHALDFAGKRALTEGIIKNYDVICIDEIDKFNVTDYAERTVFKFLDNGLSAMKRFLYGSNSNGKILREMLGENIMSRILGDCLIVENQGKLLR